MFSSSDLHRNPVWKIVVVDDDPLVLRVHVEMLKALGHAVSIFECPKRAFCYMQSFAADIDLLITDYRLPEISGLELVSQLRASGCGFPSMILTGSVNDVDAGRARACDAVVVAKPLSMHVLDGHIRAFQARSDG